jgi:hypothetical protein
LFCFVLQGYDLYQHLDRIKSKKMSQIVAKLRPNQAKGDARVKVGPLIGPTTVMKHVAGKDIRLRFHLHVSNEN